MPMSKQELIIVTGATGFIGSNLLYGLEDKGYTNIVGIDTFGRETKWMNVAKRRCTYFVLPEQMPTYLESNKDKIVAIIHLGGISSTTETDVDKIVKNNIQLSIQLYNFCKQHNIQFIYASSAATYGITTNDWGSFEDVQDIEDLRQLKPMNAYGWSKHCVDKYIAADRKNVVSNNQVVGLKFFNVYGPNEYHKGEQMSVITKFYNQYTQLGKASLFKFDNHSRATMLDKGVPKRDFVYVNDCVDVILWMLEHKDVSGLYNVGTGLANTFQDVAYYVAKCIGKKPEIEYVEMPESLKIHYQDYTCADIRKLRYVGYKADMTNLYDGIKDYVNNFLNTTDKYK